jgi:hypothetical protein
MPKSILYKHILFCSQRKRIIGLTFFRQVDNPISVKCENFKVPQVSNVSWDVFKQIASQDLRKQKETSQEKKTHYSISNNVMWGIPYVCRKKKAQA